MTLPVYPLPYQINTRVWLTELSRDLGRPATLDDIPDAELDRLAEMGFDYTDRDGNDLQSQGLFLDMSSWQAAVFSWTKGR